MKRIVITGAECTGKSTLAQALSLHYREPRQGRNPRTGDTVALRGKHVPHFKPGKELRERVNRAVKSGF